MESHGASGVRGVCPIKVHTFSQNRGRDATRTFHSQGVSLGLVRSRVVITTDASTTGWGGNV